MEINGPFKAHIDDSTFPLPPSELDLKNWCINDLGHLRSEMVVEPEDPLTAPRPAHSDDGDTLPYVSSNQYIAAMSSISSSDIMGLTLEEQQLLYKFRQEKLGSQNESKRLTTALTEGGHLYEELPGLNYKPSLPPMRSHRSMADEKFSRRDTADTICEKFGHTSYKSQTKKENVLYDTSERKADSPYSETDSESMDSKIRQSKLRKSGLRCCVITAALIFVLSVTAIVVMVLISAKIIDIPEPTKVTHPATLPYSSEQGEFQANVTQQILLMKNELEQLKEENLHLQHNLAQSSSALADVTKKMDIYTNATDRISLELSPIYSLINLLNSSLTSAVYNISLTPGPSGAQGPPGYINPRLCDYNTTTKLYSGGQGIHITTEAIQDTRSAKVISAWCSAENFASTELVVDRTFYGRSYACRCKNKSSSDGVCSVSYWQCALA